MNSNQTACRCVSSTPGTGNKKLRRRLTAELELQKAMGYFAMTSFSDWADAPVAKTARTQLIAAAILMTDLFR